MTEGKTDGFYVDLGSHDAQFHSNTYALEQLGWNGLLVDVVSGCESRRGRFVKCDASNPNDSLKLNYAQLPLVCDYLSLDTDDALIGSFVALPWDKVTFRCITLETDVYRIGPKVRDQTRAMLKAMGYFLVCGDVVVEWPEGNFVSYEDWHVCPDLVDPSLILKFQSDGKYWKEILGLPQ